MATDPVELLGLHVIDDEFGVILGRIKDRADLRAREVQLWFPQDGRPEEVDDRHLLVRRDGRFT